jgi:hypothetical protein
MGPAAHGAGRQHDGVAEGVQELTSVWEQICHGASGADWIERLMMR